MAIWYVDPINGKDRPIVTNAVARNPYGTAVLITYLPPIRHDLNTGDSVILSAFTAYINGTRTITVVDDYSFILDDITWQTTPDATGTVTPVVGRPDATSWATAVRQISTIPYNLILTTDEVRFAKTDEPISIGNATWTKGSADIVTETQLTQEIDAAVGGTWTPVSGVTLSTNKKRKVGATSLSIATGTIIGKLAYITLGSTLDLSSFTKVCLYAQHNTSSINFINSGFKLCLCSDTLGDVPVNELLLPIDHLLTANVLSPCEIDNIIPLGSSIKSVALYKTTQVAAATLLINHIFATNTISLHTLIGKSNGIFKEWFTIKSIINNTIRLDANQETNNGFIIDDETETVECFVRKCADGKTGSSSKPILAIPSGNGNGSGTVDDFKKISGGWNKVTNEQDGETCFDGQTRSNYGMTILTSSRFVQVSRFIFARFSRGFSFAANGELASVIKDIIFIDCSVAIYSGRYLWHKNIKILNCSQVGIQLVGQSFFAEDILIKNLTASIAIGINNDTGNHYIKNLVMDNCMGSFSGGGNVTLINADIKDNCKGSFNINSAGNYFVNVYCGSTTASQYIAGPSTFINCNFYTKPTNGFSGGILKMLNYEGIIGNHFYGNSSDGMYFLSDKMFNAIQGYWELRCSTLGIQSKLRSLYYEVGEVRVTAGIETTISLWMRRRFTDMNNIDSSGYSLWLRRDMNFAIIDEDVETPIPYMEATYISSGDFFNQYLTEWFQVSIVFTPARTGVVLVELQAYQDKTHYLQFSSLSVTP